MSKTTKTETKTETKETAKPNPANENEVIPETPRDAPQQVQPQSAPNPNNENAPMTPPEMQPDKK